MYGKDQLQLPHLKLTIDVGSYVKLYEGSIMLLIGYMQEDTGEKLVHVLEYMIVDVENKLVEQSNNATEHWIPATKICDLVFVLRSNIVDTFTWLGRTDTFVRNSSNSIDMTHSLATHLF